MALVTNPSDWAAHHDYFVGIDSDGCVFDSMEIKHKECFCPVFIESFDLQPVSKYAREVWEFVNLYSRSRGANRFHALLEALRRVADREDVIRRNVAPLQLPELAEWVKRESRLGNPALSKEVERTGSEELRRVLGWSNGVNQAVAKLVRNVPPFPYVREALESLGGRADVLVVSQTPFEALMREWQEHSIDGYVGGIAGQEVGTKTEHLQIAAGKPYRPDHRLMIGDAPGDMRAAEAAGCLFFPVIPGAEEESWKALVDEGLPRFFDGRFGGAYADALAEEFLKSLPEEPSWPVRKR